MFRDEDDDLIEEIEDLLTVYDLDEILEHNDMTLAEMLTKMVLNGYMIMPEIKPV